MSEPIQQTLLRAGFRQELEVNGWSLVCDGVTFRAKLTEMDPITVQAALGDDAREASLLEGFRGEVPALKRDSRIAQGTETWKVLRRTDNPSMFKVSYIVAKIVAGKDL